MCCSNRSSAIKVPDLPTPALLKWKSELISLSVTLKYDLPAVDNDWLITVWWNSVPESPNEFDQSYRRFRNAKVWPGGKVEMPNNSRMITLNESELLLDDRKEREDKTYPHDFEFTYCPVRKFGLVKDNYLYVSIIYRFCVIRPVMITFFSSFLNTFS